jgi:hypothetical protein
LLEPERLILEQGMLSLEPRRLILELGKFFLGCGNPPRATKADPGAVKSHFRVVETFLGPKTLTGALGAHRGAPEFYFGVKKDH